MIPLWVWVAVLGCADMGLTWWGLSGGWVVELNPLMARLFEIGPWYAVAYGAGVGTLGVYVLHLFESSRPWVKILLCIALAMKIFTLVLHAAWMVQVFLLH